MRKVIHSLAVGSVFCIVSMAFFPVSRLTVVATAECVGVTLSVRWLVYFWVSAEAL